MGIYIYTAVLLFFIGCSKKNNQKLVMNGILITMVLSLATQYRIGIDYDGYVYLFMNPGHRKDLEIGYKLYTDFLRMISTNPQIVFIGISILQGILFWKILKKIKQKKVIMDISVYMFCFCFITDGYYLLFNSLRSSVASLFFILSLIYLEEKKFFKVIFLLLIGYTFHKSIIPIFLATIIFIIIGKIGMKKINKFDIELFLITCVVLNSINFIPEIAKMIYNSNFDFKYKFYLISEHMQSYSFAKGYGITKIIRICLSLGLCSLYVNGEKKNKLSSIFYNIGYLVLGLKFLFWGIPIFNRLMEYFNIPLAYIYYSGINQLRKNKYSMLVVIIGSYFLLEFLVTIYRLLRYINQ